MLTGSVAAAPHLASFVMLGHLKTVITSLLSVGQEEGEEGLLHPSWEGVGR